jgi:hypothetical protein
MRGAPIFGGSAARNAVKLRGCEKSKIVRNAQYGSARICFQIFLNFKFEIRPSPPADRFSFTLSSPYRTDPAPPPRGHAAVPAIRATATRPRR